MLQATRLRQRPKHGFAGTLTSGILVLTVLLSIVTAPLCRDRARLLRDTPGESGVVRTFAQGV
jgi:hypothetical protein